MMPETYRRVRAVFEIIIFVEMGVLCLLLLVDVAIRVHALINDPAPLVTRFFRDCHNLTLYPDGCQTWV